jgi:tetratricopeptide (TPR) repeat protein
MRRGLLRSIVLAGLVTGVASGAVRVASAQGPGQPSITIPDSQFQPITLPPTISFGYPANTIFVPQIHDLARRRDFDALDAMFSQLAADVKADVKNESRFADAFDAFDRDEPPLLQSIDAWVAARPRSAHALVARASYHLATAWRRRGTRYIRDTPPATIRAMEEFARRTTTDVNAALQRDSTHLVAYRILIRATRLVGAHDLAVQALTRGLSVHRASYVLHAAFISMLWPRWGGSEEMMIEFGQRAARDAAINPRLVTLPAAVYEHRANDSSLAGNHAGAVRELNKALAFGPERNYLIDRGKAYFRLGAYEWAFNDLRTAVIEQSQNPEALEYYGRTLVELATRARPAIRRTILDRAIETLTLAAYLMPSNTRVSTALDRARRLAGG